MLISGQHISAADCTDDSSHTPYITGPSDLIDGHILVTKYTAKPKVLCESGDILVTVKGSGTGTVFRADGQYCISRQLMAIRPILSDPGFVYHVLVFNTHKYARAAAGLIPGIVRRDLLNTRILLPPREEQCAIAALLFTWDRAIEQTRRLMEARRLLKKGLMQRLLTGRQRLPGFHKKWQWPRAEDMFRDHSCRDWAGETLLSVTQEQGIVPRGSLDARVTMPHGAIDAFKLVEPGDFVISLRSFQGGIELSNCRGIVSPAYTVLKPRGTIHNRFFGHYFKSQAFIGRLSAVLTGIREGKQIRYVDFSATKIPNPPIDEQQAIADVLDAATKEVRLLERQIEMLRLQKQALMQKLLTGQIRVKIPKEA
ncbi:MAG: restriction endonuclease subunit S [Ignavibacteriales bacterium]